MNFKNITKEYFNFFSNKDINNLSDLFDETVILKDWNIEKFGKNEVILANQNIFNSVEKITVIPIKIYCDDKTTISEIKIEVIIDNKTEYLNVIDVIEFSEIGKILSITAYNR